MKNPFPILTVAIATLVLLLSGQTASANPAQNQYGAGAPVHTAQQPSTVSTIEASKRKPMANRWDANSWDAEGGAAFWHATEDNRQPAKNLTRKATKGSGLVKKLFGKRG